jgi:hypothetical protein
MWLLTILMVAAFCIEKSRRSHCSRGAVPENLCDHLRASEPNSAATFAKSSLSRQLWHGIRFLRRGGGYRAEYESPFANPLS